MSVVAGLIRKIERFCTEAEISEATFGTRAVNDGKFVSRLRDGAGVTVRTVERAEAYMTAELARLRKARAA